MLRAGISALAFALGLLTTAQASADTCLCRPPNAAANPQAELTRLLGRASLEGLSADGVSLDGYTLEQLVVEAGIAAGALAAGDTAAGNTAAGDTASANLVAGDTASAKPAADNPGMSLETLLRRAEQAREQRPTGHVEWCADGSDPRCAPAHDRPPQRPGPLATSSFGVLSSRPELPDAAERSEAALATKGTGPRRGVRSRVERPPTC
jgi:hypothetical protein